MKVSILLSSHGSTQIFVLSHGSTQIFVLSWKYLEVPRSIPRGALYFGLFRIYHVFGLLSCLWRRFLVGFFFIIVHFTVKFNGIILRSLSTNTQDIYSTVHMYSYHSEPFVLTPHPGVPHCFSGYKLILYTVKFTYSYPILCSFLVMYRIFFQLFTVGLIKN